MSHSYYKKISFFIFLLRLGVIQVFLKMVDTENFAIDFQDKYKGLELIVRKLGNFANSSTLVVATKLMTKLAIKSDSYKEMLRKWGAIQLLVTLIKGRGVSEVSTAVILGFLKQKKCC